jgi:UDP-N-acetylmuramate--L-alanine ligase/UDP-N-acetylenolpyruvoylglucosamine reductase
VSGEFEALRPTVRVVDLTRPQRVHILGIGGAGMRAIARVLLAMGHTVSGTDRAASEHVDALIELGASVKVGHDHPLPAVDVVTRSTAVPDDNPEVLAARASGIAVLARAEMLTAISAAQPSILVAGTHGKTTTSSMLAVVLDAAGRNPSFIIGSDVAWFETGARWMPETEMVIEADESDGTFLALQGAHAIVTSLDPDHLEYYGSQENLDAAFVAFVEGIDGVTAVCIDDADTGPLIELSGVVTYGTHADGDLRISNITVDRLTTHMELSWRGESLGRFSVGLPGHHNALNAAGAAAVALSLDVAVDAVRDGLSGFDGVARRFEQRGRAGGVTFVDDYAHLPAEVEAAIATATAGGWSRVIAAYQPHRYSRTQLLGHTFANSFGAADHLVLAGIYPSGEAPREGVTGRILFDAVTEATPDLAVTYGETLDDVTRALAAELRRGDLCLTLGAGDLTTVPTRLIALRHATWAAELDASLIASKVSVNEPLGPRTTYRVGGAARTFVDVTNAADLETVASLARDIDEPILVIGRGSNLLVADAGFDGVAIALSGEFEQVSISDNIVVAGAAVPLPALARQTVAAGLAGFEWAVGVPGSIGGAITMNAGGHGSDMAASVISVRVLDASTGTVETWDPERLAFAYRESAIASHHLVIDATLQLEAGDAEAGSRLLSEIVHWRREHQPGGQNAGSVFTNPDGDSAGRLIDAAGGKGLRVGTAEISTKHANFIQADVDGSANDVFEVMRAAAQLVEASTGIRLHAETRLVGFPPLRSSRRSVVPATMSGDAPSIQRSDPANGGPGSSSTESIADRGES